MVIKIRLSNFTQAFHRVDSWKVRTRSSRFSTYFLNLISKNMQTKKLSFIIRRKRKKRKRIESKGKRERLTSLRGRIQVAVRNRVVDEEQSVVNKDNQWITKQCRGKLEFHSVEPNQYSLPLSLKPMHPSINLSRVKSRASSVSTVASLTKRMMLLHIAKSMTSTSSLQSSQRSQSSQRTHHSKLEHLKVQVSK